MRTSPAVSPAAGVLIAVCACIGWTASAKPVASVMVLRDRFESSANYKAAQWRARGRYPQRKILDWDARGRQAAPRDSLAVELLLQLAAFLGLDREGRRGAREQPLDADGLAGFLAIAVAAVVDAGQGLVDLLQQLPLAVARAQLQRMLFLECRAVGRIGRERQLAQVL